MSDDAVDRGVLNRIDVELAALRADDDRRRIALAGALVAGLALAWLHWLGLVVAGALVGLTRRSVPRAVLAGLGVGVLSLALMAIATPVGPTGVLALTPASYLTLALAVVAPVWGSLVRAIL